MTVTVKTKTAILVESSDANGDFVVNTVPAGDATVSLKKVGYAKDPTEITVMVVAGNNPVPQVNMWQPGKKGGEYFMVVAKNLLQRVEKDKVKRHGLAVEWIHLTSAGVPLTFKWELVGEMHKMDDGLAKDLPILGEYRAVDVEKLQSLQEICQKAARGKARFPEQVGEFIAKERIPNRLCADAFISTIYAVDLNMDQRRSFAAKLQELRGFGEEVNAAVKPWTKMPEIEWGLHNPEKGDSYKELLRSYIPD